MFENIPRKKYPVETIFDGITLQGCIEYWDKDYSITLEKPFYAENTGGHLMYAVPVKYSTHMDDFFGTKHTVDLSERGEQLLKELYQKHKDIPFEKYVETLFERHKEYFVKFRKEFETLDFKNKKRKLKTEFKNEILSQQQFQNKFKVLRRKNDDIESKIEERIYNYFEKRGIPFDGRDIEKMIELLKEEK